MLQALSYLGAAALAVAVVWSIIVMLGGPGDLKSFNNRCDTYSAACGTAAGFLIPLLSVATAYAAFITYRLRYVRSPIAQKAKTAPAELVETATPDISVIVGRDELCEVIMEDIRQSDIRRPHLLVGGVGAGKTAVLVRLTKLLADRGAIPVPIRLRDAKEGLDFRTMAYDRFRGMTEGRLLPPGAADKAWRQLRKDDKIVVIADGLEEALTEGSAHQERDNLIRLAIHRAREIGMPLIIASRPHDPLRGADATIMELEPLSEEAALEYIDPDNSSIDARRLDWIVETAGLTELPLYLQITRQLSQHDRLDHISADRSAKVDTRSLDRSKLRLHLLDTWMEALFDGHLRPAVPLNRAEREAGVEWLSALACLGLVADTIDVKFDDYNARNGESQTSPRYREIDQRIHRFLDKKLPRRHLDIPLAVTWGDRLNLVEAHGDGLRFPHSIMQAYLGSRFMRTALADEDFRNDAQSALLKPGREFLIALVLYSRSKAASQEEQDRPALAAAPDRSPRALVAVQDAITAAPAVQQDAEASVSAPGGKAAAKAAARAAAKAAARAAAKADGRTGAKADGKKGAKADGKTDAKSDGTTGAKAGGDAGGRAGGDAGAKADGDAGGRAGGDAGAKAGGDAGAKAGGDAGGQTGGQPPAPVLRDNVRSIRDVLEYCAVYAVDDIKKLDLYAAALEIDSFLSEPHHQEIASHVARQWGYLRGGDQRTLDEAKLGLVHRFGDAARAIVTRAKAAPLVPESHQQLPDPAYRQLLEIGLREVSYSIRLAIAQEIGAGGDEAFRVLRAPLPSDMWKATAWPAEAAIAARLRQDQDQPPDGAGQENGDRNSTLRGRTVCAWVTPLLVGSVDERGEAARAELQDWLDRVGRTSTGAPESLPLPLSLEVALAQGFKYAANRRRRHPHALPEARFYLQEKALEMLKRARFWFSQLTLIHALCLWEMPDQVAAREDTADARAGGSRTRDRAHRHGSNPEAIVHRWLEVCRNGEHPFVDEAAKLAVLALKTRRPERFLWIDESGIVSSVGSRPSQAANYRKHHLWIPPSAGWAALDPRAQQLVADVLLILNLAERGEQPDEIDQRLSRVDGSDLPPCLTQDRDPLDPTKTVGGLYTAPGSNCMDGCRFGLCPYPPKGGQPYRSELSEAFCRGQQTLLSGGFKAPWQPMGRADLKDFWAQMADRARA